MAVPVALDLAPWRRGPKHFPVQGSVPWVPGWLLAPNKPQTARFSMRALGQAVQNGALEAILLKGHLAHALTPLQASEARWIE